MLMAELSWLTDELSRRHCMADTQLPGYSYMFSSYTNKTKQKLFHKDTQHQMFEVGDLGLI